MNPTQASPDFTAEDIAALVDTVQRFATQAVAPHVPAWEADGELPRSLHREAAEVGLLGLGYPEHLGGTPAPWRARNAMSRTLARHGGSGGVMASLFTHNIGLPPVLAHGTPELQQEVIPPVLRGEQIAALGITEPGGGSDVAALRTTARREGDDYVIDGEKVFITSGMRCDWITLAVRTDAHNKGAGGISMIVVPCNAPGVSRTRLEKMGWHCSDTAHLRFDSVRVPARYRLGAEGAGFRIIMGNFNGERLALAAMALGFAEACFDEALAWARQRSTFGAPLIERQVIRHQLMDMQMRIHSTASWVEALSARVDAGDAGADWVAQVCLLKNHATQTMQFCADAAVQILGGMGYMRGTVSERVYREVKVMMIGGGAEEIMKELAARQWGL
ncbi:MAG: acyl-CoA dehydrogenase family protein [Hydrogenophaga sp.]|jgi:acyl-CoA dehydrogenase|uniref:acyl-CoA dehydrogenase family protein n=1 Tax=Hydrogenophaga sp. TaxID=1904254 RepID=UPI001D6AC117|nr:acyl-CoA dehydrogenase family protein [Hydrogenophaga sp.]MBW0171638.1 acyl-CoA dehydrogenase family protein [Hydrogenophaga sp.]MBW0184172.1 acyl-CoA dehydrogenase family protein [Hydrogenophaga sp.]